MPNDQPVQQGTVPEAGATRHDIRGKLRCMVVVDGYVMVRRPRAIPFVLSLKDWLLLSVDPVPAGMLVPSATLYGVSA